MKKIIIKITALALCLCSLLLVACDSHKQTETPGTNNNNNSNIPEASGTVNDLAYQKVEGTIHYGYDDLKDTGMPFVVNMTTEYKLVYDESNSYKLEAAAYLLSNVKNATGATVEKENSPKWSSDAKYIIVGDKTLEEAAGVSITTEYDLGSQGYQILTKDNSVFILANSGEGYHLGVLAFLNIVVGYQYISEKIIAYEKDGSYIPEMNIIERPDFDYRVVAYEYGRSSQNAYGTGTIVDSKAIIAINGNRIHNVFDYINPDVYETEHPEWFTEKRSFEVYTDKIGIWPAQLCYTARGDEESLLEMQTIIAEKIVELAMLPENASRYIITVTQRDEQWHCNCEACAAIEAEYGAASAAAIMFTNGIDDIVREKLKQIAAETGDPERELQILWFAYQDTRFAPTKIDEKVMCNPGVGIYFAASKTKYSYTFYDEINKAEAESIKAFGQLGKMYFYTYRYNTATYLIPSNIYSTSVANFRFLKENNGNFVVEESGYEQPFFTGFTVFKEYITSRLLHNVNIDFTDMQDTFFTHYFGPANEPMEQFFNELTEYMFYMRDQGIHDFDGRCVTEYSNKKEYWPYQMIIRWQSLCDEAFKAIEAVKVTDPELYQIYYDNILLETLFPQYVLCKLHTEQYTESELYDMRVRFFDDCARFNYKREDAYDVTIDDLKESWGIK